MENEKTTIDELAVMIKGGFDEMSDQLKKVNTRLGVLEVGQEDIKLRLDNVAYRFEMVELAKRVTVLEEHAGIVKRGS